MTKAVIILSGGLDSTVCLAYAHKIGCHVYALSFTYGQSHVCEIEQAKKITQYYKCEHLVVNLEFFSKIGGSSLTDKDLEIPTDRDDEQISVGIPSTYVPFRNGVFLAIACSYAEAVGAEKVFIGVNALDYSGYPDCRPEFISAFQHAVSVGTRQGSEEKKDIQIITPLLQKTKAEIVQMGIDLEAPLHLTTSCYQGEEKACGRCDSCKLRLKGFQEAGHTDPIEYENNIE